MPWYWNIAPNYDATLMRPASPQRGLRIDPEFRYLTERSRGMLDVEYLSNDLEDDATRSIVELDAPHATSRRGRA